MKRWDLRSLAPSTKKQRARAPGADAPRVARSGLQMPRVLFTSPECRAVVIDLRAGEELGDHRVRERAVVEVVSGRVSIEASGEVFVLGLADRAILGDALTRFSGAGVEILSCHLERPPIEDAVVALFGGRR